MKFLLRFFLFSLLVGATFAQTPPSSSELDQYDGLFAAVAKGDIVQVEKLVADKVNLESRDSAGRTPLLVATHFSNDDVARILLEAGADANALDHQRYDLITIAAVNNDEEMIQLGLKYGADPAATTSPYDGTALIAACHLGH
ncbi:MAG: ankyrin repeat domain-containing protein, partial [Gammaproteobacteria bacterium]|nr:ankyrin repeat domain-containing protein [Gammaproteobacteria bacterium]